MYLKGNDDIEVIQKTLRECTELEGKLIVELLNLWKFAEMLILENCGRVSKLILNFQILYKASCSKNSTAATASVKKENSTCEISNAENFDHKHIDISQNNILETSVN